jgi:hypothetical protein
MSHAHADAFAATRDSLHFSLLPSMNLITLFPIFFSEFREVQRKIFVATGYHYDPTLSSINFATTLDLHLALFEFHGCISRTSASRIKLLYSLESQPLAFFSFLARRIVACLLISRFYPEQLQAGA